MTAARAEKNLAKPLTAVTVTVAETDLPARLDALLARQMPWRSRTFFCRMIENGEVLVNDRRARPGRRMAEHDVVVLDITQYQQPYAPPADIALEIIHEDAGVLVVNKEPGVVIHPTGVHLYDTLLNALHARYADAAYKPRPVHRLDKETSGVLVLAKSEKARTHLARQIEGRRITKAYLALVHGVVAYRSGEIMLPLGDSRHSHIRLKQDVVDDGLPAHTRYEVVASAPCVPGFLDGLSLLDVRILTGRTHQIRVHMAAVGHPVVGDKLYGREGACQIGPVHVTHHLLHARSFACIHPGTNEPVEFTAPLPRGFAACVEHVFGVRQAVHSTP